KFLPGPVPPSNTADIGALAWPDAGDKERHVRRLWQLRRRLLRLLLLCFDAGHHAERRERQCGDNECLRLVHRTPLRWRFPDAYERVTFRLLGDRLPHRIDVDLTLIAKPHIGGVVPARPTEVGAASSVPSSFLLAAAMKILAPGLSSLLSAGT